MKKILLPAIAISSIYYANSQSNTHAVKAPGAMPPADTAFSIQAKDEDSIRSLFIIMEEGWNEKSGKKFSSVFADVHDYIVVDGMYFPGFTKERNAAAHQGLFDGIYKAQDIKLKVDKVDFFRSDLAQVIIIGGGYSKGQAIPTDPTIIMTIIVEKKNEVWRIISFHNHELNAERIKQRSPMPLTVMYASWYK